MTTTDPFTTPIEAEREARVKQAGDMLASAAGVQHVVRSTYNRNGGYTHDYGDGVEAIRDAIVGQGHAMMAVRDQLADIASSLRTLTATPTVLTQLDDTMRGGLDEVAEQVRENGTLLLDLTKAVNEHGDAFGGSVAAVAEAVDGLAQIADRPRWWQARRRGALRHAEVHEYLIEVRQGCPPWESASSEVLGRVRFYATPVAACDTANTMLPGLVAQLGADTMPDRVHGLVYQRDAAGPCDGYVGMVFLPTPAVPDVPEERAPIT